MTALNNLLGTLTGPRRLRSALRQKTVAISSLLIALEGPAELRVRIPAAVFGGDIFGVMSSQLREALVIALNPTKPQLKHEPRRSIAASAFATLNDPSNPFPPISDWLKRSTQWADSGHDVAAIATRAQSEPPAEQRSVSPFSPLETQLSRKGMGEILFDETQSSVKPLLNAAGSSRTSSLPPTPALISSLERYWQAVREERDTRHSHSQPLTESPANTVSFSDAGSEQRAAPRAWPTSVGREVSQKLRSFADVNVPLKSRLSSAPGRQIQNVFNIEVNHANHESSNFDDLGDRLAQILHEQALQHGIDVT